MKPPPGDAARHPISYPTRYPLKVFGLAGEGFAEHVAALVERAAGVATAGPPSVRASQGGTYLAVTLEVELTSEGQRLAIYRALQVDARVVYAL